MLIRYLLECNNQNYQKVAATAAKTRTERTISLAKEMKQTIKVAAALQRKKGLKSLVYFQIEYLRPIMPARNTIPRTKTMYMLNYVAW